MHAQGLLSCRHSRKDSTLPPLRQAPAIAFHLELHPLRLTVEGGGALPGVLLDEAICGGVRGRGPAISIALCSSRGQQQQIDGRHMAWL